MVNNLFLFTFDQTKIPFTMHKVFVLIAAFLLVTNTTKAQKSTDVFYVFKSDWSSAEDLNHAVYFMQVVAENDTTFYCRYYNKTGPMVKQECYKDSDLSVPNGLFAWYDTKGRIDSCGFVYERKKDGNWRYFDDSMRVVMTSDYDAGKFIRTHNFITKKILYPDGREESAEPVADKSDTTVKVFKVVQTEARLKGGPKEWVHYLQNNLRIPDRMINLNKSGTVVVEFDVDTTGNIDLLMIAQSVEWSADAEALRVIKNGPKWLPAVQNGRFVRYKQRQSITLSVN